MARTQSVCEKCRLSIKSGAILMCAESVPFKPISSIGQCNTFDPNTWTYNYDPLAAFPTVRHKTLSEQLQESVQQSISGMLSQQDSNVQQTSEINESFVEQLKSCAEALQIPNADETLKTFFREKFSLELNDSTDTILFHGKESVNYRYGSYVIAVSPSVPPARIFQLNTSGYSQIKGFNYENN